VQAKTIKGQSSEEIKTAVQQCMSDHFHPTLAIIVLTKTFNAESLRFVFTEMNIEIFGVSTSEKFTEQGIESDDIIVLLFDIPTPCFSILVENYEVDRPYEAALKVGQAGTNAFNNPAFIISTADNRMSGEDVIKGLTDAAGNEATIIGGVAGDPADFSGILFSQTESCTKGIIALIIDQDRISITGRAISGWKPIGTEKKITKSEGSWIYTIDNEPALEIIQKFLGKEIIDPEKSTQGLVPSDLGYPLQFENIFGNALMRPILVSNTNDRSIMVGGEVKEGSSFRFSLPPDFDVIDTVIESTRREKEKSMPDVDALIVFSCIGRLGTFGPMINTEIEGLAATWNKPMIGFFSLGEFGKLNEGPSEFHGTTVSWVALTEKS
jgi:hypothetical protein